MFLNLLFFLILHTSLQNDFLGFWKDSSTYLTKRKHIYFHTSSLFLLSEVLRNHDKISKYETILIGFGLSWFPGVHWTCMQEHFLNHLMTVLKYDFQSTVEPRLSGPRLSGLFDYLDFFSGPNFFMNIN